MNFGRLTKFKKFNRELSTVSFFDILESKRREIARIFSSNVPENLREIRFDSFESGFSGIYFREKFCLEIFRLINFHLTILLRR
jgi:hypothetical protein